MALRSERYGYFIFVLTILFSASWSIAQDRDTDGDGLSDFHETYKYLTDPNNSDSDGDGIEDGDWKERREFQYIIRSVVQVMRPVTIEYLNDDYQDAKILDETESYVELEVIHYPFNKVATAIEPDANWRDNIGKRNGKLARWLQAGPTSDWTEELRQEIVAALKADDVDTDKLDDKQLVEKYSRWLLKRAEYQDGFSCFCTAFDDRGEPFIPEDLKDHVGKGSDLTPEMQWDREVSAAGMFRNQVRGSCSSSAIYISGCMRAIGIPTRTILCIPIVDAGDEREMEMVRQLDQSGVRQTLLQALGPLKNSWASHTFNEVYVGGRWRRLNYDRLGQNTYDPGMFGLMTHIATFHDWADARMPETIGRRQSQGRAKDIFGGANPYSTIALRDKVGEHCKLELPTANTVTLRVEQIHWTDSPDLPEEIRGNCERRGRFGLIADVTGFDRRETVEQFLSEGDLRVYLEVNDVSAASKQDKKSAVRLGIGFDRGCYWVTNNLLRIYVPFGGGDKRDLKPNVEYRFQPRNSNKDFRWIVDDDLTITRKKKDS